MNNPQSPTLYTNSHPHFPSSIPYLQAHPSFQPLNNIQHQRQRTRITRPTRRLHIVNIISPPWSTTPPKSSQPDIGIARHIRQHIRDGTITLIIGAAGKLAEDTLLVVGLQPGGSSSETLGADGGRDAGGAGTGAVGVEVLVHFVDDFVLGVGEGG